jgi:hypothetical protein
MRLSHDAPQFYMRTTLFHNRTMYILKAAPLCRHRYVARLPALALDC